MPASGWNVSGPFLSDTEAEQVMKPGGFGQPEPTSAATDTLLALQSQPHIYGGTVDPVIVAARRRRNKTARRSRRKNRR